MELKSIPSGAVVPPKKRFFEQSNSWTSDNASFTPGNGKPTCSTCVSKREIVECDNKDLYKQDLTDPWKEMKHQLCDLQNNQLHLQEDLRKVNANYEKAKNKIKTVHQCQRKLLTKCTRKTIGKVEECQKFLTDNYITLLEEKTNELDNKEQKIMQLEEECKQLKEKYEQDLNCAQSRHQEEVQNVEYEMLKTVSDMQEKLKKEQERHEKFLKESLAQQESKINNMCMQLEEEKTKLETYSELTENFKQTSMLAEMQMKEKCNDIENHWKLKLEKAEQESNAILKKSEDIAAFNVHCNAEQCKHVKELKLEKDKLYADYELLHESYKDLHRDTVEHQHTAELFIETLKKRLMRSDQDIEQLKAQLDVTQGFKLELEDRCNQLEDELQRASSVRDELMDQYEMNLIVTQDRIDNCKRGAQMQVRRVTEKLEKAEEELRSVRNLRF